MDPMFPGNMDHMLVDVNMSLVHVNTSVAVANALSPLTSPVACHRGRHSGRYSLLSTSLTWRQLSQNMVCHCISTLTTIRYMAHVSLMPPLCSLLCHSVLTASSAGYILIASNSIPTRRMWCAVHPLVSCHNFRVFSSLVCPVNAVRDLGVFIDSDLGAATNVRRTVSCCFASSITFVNTSLISASALWWCRLYIEATSSGFLFIYSCTYSLFSTLWLVWYFDYSIRTMSQMHLQLCTGCVYLRAVEAPSINAFKFRLIHIRYNQMGFFMISLLSSRPCWLHRLPVTLHKVNHFKVAVMAFRVLHGLTPQTWISWLVSATCPDVADFGQHHQTNRSCHHSN